MKKHKLSNKIISIILLLTIFLSNLSIISSAAFVLDGDSSADDNNGMFEFDSETGHLTVFENYFLPNPNNKINRVYACFEGNESIKSVEYTGNASVVYASAFKNCINLETVILSDKVTSIGSSAFYNCTNLKKISIPNKVTSIAVNTFYNCSDLEGMILPDSVSSVGNYAFYNCTNLRKLVIPDKVDYLEEYTLYNCSALTELSIPCTLDFDYSHRTFGSCKNIKTINITKGYNGIMNSTASGVTEPFKYRWTEYNPWYKSNCETINIESGVVRIGAYSFMDCQIGTINIADTVKEVGSGAFKRCTVKNGIKLPTGTKKLGENVFSGCQTKYIYLPKSIDDFSKSSLFSAPSNLYYIHKDSPIYDLITQGEFSEEDWNYIVIENIVNTKNDLKIDFDKNLIMGLSSISDLNGIVKENGYNVQYDKNMRRSYTGMDIDICDSEGDSVYTVKSVVFGDTNGDSWYDGTDAVIVSCIANGMLTKEQVGEAVWTAADCNHDGVIDELDVALLEQAGVLLQDVDQSKSTEELLATSSAYNEYVNLISQNPTADDEPTDEGSQMTLIDRIIAFVMKLVEYIKSSLEFFIKKV